MSKISTNTIGSIDGTYEIDVKDIQPIGVGQTWQDVTSQRELDVEYTNDTDRSIMVSVRAGDPAVGGWIELFVNDVRISGNYQTIENGGTAYISGIVPPGATYRVLNSPDSELNYWSELRS